MYKTRLDLRVTIWAAFALLLTCSAAWAQTSAGVLGTLFPSIVGAIGGTEAIIGFALPPILSIIMQSAWPWKAKANVAWLACFLVAIVVTLAQGQLTGDWTSLGVVTAKFTAILLFASQTFDKFWKPTGVADSIEKATDISKPSESTPDSPSTVFDETPTSGFNIEDFNVGASTASTPDKVDLKDEAVNKIIQGVGGYLMDKLKKD